MSNNLEKTYDKAQTKKLEFIDALRGIASLIVVVYHLVLVPQPNLPVPRTLDKFIHVGSSGVILFFVISAFTIYLSADNRKNETKKTTKFYLRRLFRIAPLFYFMLGVHLLVSRFIFHNTPSWKLILLNLTFTYNFSMKNVESIVWAGWTIGVEMLFYLLVPFLFNKINNLQKSIAFTIFTIFLADIYTSFLNYNLTSNKDIMEKYLYMNFLNQLPAFSIGIICYFVYKSVIFNIKPMNRATISLLLLSSFVLLFMGIVNNRISLFIPVIYWQALSFVALVISLALLPNQWLVNRVTCFYGKISYSTYLVHPLLIFFLIPIYRYIYNNIALSTFISFVLCLLLTLICLTLISLSTYSLIEEPAIKYGKQIILKL